MRLAAEVDGTAVPNDIFIQNEDHVTIPTLLRRHLQAAALFALCAIGAAVHASTINLSTAATTYHVGQGFSVDFRIDGLTGATGDSLSAFDIDVLFDGTLLQLTGYGFTDPASNRNELDLPEAGSFGFNGAATASGNVIDALGVSGNSAEALDAGQGGGFRFLTLSFQALAASASTAIEIDLSDNGLLFLDSGFGNLDARFGASRVAFAITQDTSAVPEPGSLALLAIGAAGMLLAGRRRVRTGGAALALALAAAVPASAQQPAVQAQQATTAAAPTAVTGTILKVEGRRAQVKLSNGVVEWVSVAGGIATDKVGKSISGKLVPRGDTLLLTEPVIAN
jgi:hypothetical protein